MQIQQRWPSSSLSKAVCHSHGGRLLQTEYIFEVWRKVLKKRLLCRTGVPEDRGQPQLPQQVVGCVVDGQGFLFVTHGSLQGLGRLNFPLDMRPLRGALMPQPSEQGLAYCSRNR